MMVRYGEAGRAGVRILLQWCNILLTMVDLEVNLRRTAEQIYSGQHWTDAPVLWAMAPASQLPAPPLAESRYIYSTTLSTLPLCIPKQPRGPQ